MQKIALVVDDSRVARMTLSKLLISHSFEVIELSSGEEAISHLQMMATKPDIIFMDVMMGGMDGLTTTRKIKSNSSLSTIPIVICTGNDSETDKENALATGAMSVLSKPPSIEELDAILTNLEASIQIEVPQAESIVAPVNDDEITLKVMAAIEQNLVPKLQQDMHDTAEQMVTNQVDSLIPSISEQVLSQSKTVTEALAQQIATETAQQAVQSSLAGIDISTQVSQTLSSEGVAWLKHQQQKIHEELSENLQQTIVNGIQQNLQTELEPRVTPLVSDQINKHLAQQMIDDEQVIKTLSKKVSRLKGMVIVLGIIVVALAVLTLAPQLNLL
ncbi:MAG: PleD family two-component system response regulator [Methylophagaceae bacterium]